MSKQRWWLFSIVVVLLVTTVAVVALWRLSAAPAVAPSRVASSRTPVPSLPRTPTPSPSPTPVDPDLVDCMPKAIEILPARIAIPAMKVDSPIIKVGLEEGAAGAPPLSEGFTVAWYDGSPRPGAIVGKSILTAHTNVPGYPKMLGNALNDPNTGLKPGQVIRISDKQGRVLCYRYKNTLKVSVAKYDPNSDIFYDDSGLHQIAWMVCWDYNARTKNWDSRLIIYADPIFPSARPAAGQR